jgi:CxxC motif-containing protein (DUF1111 family)
MKALAITLSGCAAPLLALVLTSCGSEDRAQTDMDPDRDRLGGDTTVFDDSQNAFAYPARNASAEHRDRFFVGNSFFKQNWVTAPASTEARDGLGPLFNARSCSSCHLNDGRGRPPLDADEPIVGLLFRLSTAEGPDPSYGGQIQPYAINGVAGEAHPAIEYQPVSDSYADGAAFTLLKPVYSFDNLAYGPLAAGLMVSPRVAPQMIGLGLLELVPESSLLEFADPDDLDQDGISGRPNWLVSLESGAQTLGRFGWKANQPSLREQTSGAFLGDLGITSSLHPTDECSATEVDCAGVVNGGSPEIDEARLNDVVLYSQLLAVPARRDLNDEQALRGEAVFQTLGCASCHVSSMTTGVSDRFPELSGQRIRPYTDLMLHDLGPELADGRPDAEATGSEWRTPPLWGIGLLETVNQHTRLLHDGRARNAEEAILWHGGEATDAREAFRTSSSADRSALLRFLESL